MPTLVDLPLAQVKDALTTKSQGISRQITTAANPLIKEILEKDRAAIQSAMTTLTETKK